MTDRREGNRPAKPSPTVRGAAHELYDTSDIRFVMREVATLTERISNLIDKQFEAGARLDKQFDKFEQRFKEVDTAIAAKTKEVTDKIEPLQSSATWIKGYLAGLVAVILVIAWLFHDELGKMAESVAKMGGK